MAGVGLVNYRPNLCFCGHDAVVHTPNCTQCPNPHVFSADPPSIQTSATGAGANANGQRNG